MILIRISKEHPISHIKGIIDLQEIVNLREDIWNTHVDETIQNYIVALIHATRNNPDITLGASPRATLALFKGCQALAALRGRDHVIPDDVKYLFIPTISHRLMIRPESALRGKNSSSLLKDILDTVSIPLET